MNLEGEELLTLSQAARLFPGHRGAKSTSRVTVGRWITRGNRTADGSRVKLEGVRVGSSWMTSREAVNRYLEALSRGRTDESVPTPTPQPKRTGARERLVKHFGMKLTSTAK